jgi:hypothetical protein
MKGKGFRMQEKTPQVEIPEKEKAVLDKYDVNKSQIDAFMNQDTKEIEITTLAQFENAQLVRVSIHNYKQELVAAKKVVCDPLHQKHKIALAEFAPKIDYLTEKMECLDKGAKVFKKNFDDQQAKAQIAQNLEAAQTIIKNEAKADDAAKTAEEYQGEGRDDKAAEWQAKSEYFKSTASNTVAAIVTIELPKIRGGLNTKTKWAARVKDEKLLLEHFKAGLPPDILEAIQKWLSAQARAAKSTVCPYPGGEFYEVL